MQSFDLRAGDRQTASTSGVVVGVTGSVVDVAFPDGDLPGVYTALEVLGHESRSLTLEVQHHLDSHTIRAVAMQTTAGLARGAAVRSTGAPIHVPVGEAVLGRMLDVVGNPVDRLGPFPSEVERRPIHQAAPRLIRQSHAREAFWSGIKVIDLLAPLARGGKAGMFGGAGVGKTVLPVADGASGDGHGARPQRLGGSRRGAGHALARCGAVAAG